MKLSLGYPNAEQERAMLTAYREKSPLDDLSPVCSGRDILKAQAQVAKIRVSQPVAATLYLWQTLPASRTKSVWG